ncbi:hypothetical protein [Cypionkella sp.]|uniref:hypothetical protein n=1 Tax=Cypionkella sp. TaxID=2811411 RepID=UPI00261A569D|nr:hypothetical protein [Cypionkella sp.]
MRDFYPFTDGDCRTRRAHRARGRAETLPNIPIGARVRILPVHACATVAMHQYFSAVASDGSTITADWPIMRGW